jgi:hypothetical protein
VVSPEAFLLSALRRTVTITLCSYWSCQRDLLRFSHVRACSSLFVASLYVRGVSRPSQTLFSHSHSAPMLSPSPALGFTLEAMCKGRLPAALPPPLAVQPCSVSRHPVATISSRADPTSRECNSANESADDTSTLLSSPIALLSSALLRKHSGELLGEQSTPSLSVYATPPATRSSSSALGAPHARSVTDAPGPAARLPVDSFCLLTPTSTTSPASTTSSPSSSTVINRECVHPTAAPRQPLLRTPPTASVRFGGPTPASTQPPRGASSTRRREAQSVVSHISAGARSVAARSSPVEHARQDRHPANSIHAHGGEDVDDDVIVVGVKRAGSALLSHVPPACKRAATVIVPAPTTTAPPAQNTVTNSAMASSAPSAPTLLSTDAVVVRSVPLLLGAAQADRRYNPHLVEDVDDDDGPAATSLHSAVFTHPSAHSSVTMSAHDAQGSTNTHTHAETHTCRHTHGHTPYIHTY